MNTNLIVGLALMAPVALVGIVWFVIWAVNHPKDLVQLAIGLSIALGVLAFLVGACFIANIWWAWWALPVVFGIIAGCMAIGIFVDTAF